MLVEFISSDIAIFIILSRRNGKQWLKNFSWFLFSIIVCNSKSNHKGMEQEKCNISPQIYILYLVIWQKCIPYCHITNTKQVSGVYSIDVNA